MKRVLFLTTIDCRDGMSGGAVCSRQNRDAVAAYYGPDAIRECRIVLAEPPPGRLERLWFFCRQLLAGPLILNLPEILELAEGHELVFLEGSAQGGILRKFRRRPGRRVMVFFHNCEYAYVRSVYASAPWWKRWWLNRLVFRNEKTAVTRADLPICLNQRDAVNLRQYYSVAVENRIPIAMTDRFRSYEIVRKSAGSIKTFTFLGSNFPPNLRGIRWFLREVLPRVRIRLVIVGRGMSCLREELAQFDRQVELYSDVSDLHPYLAEADYMLFPVFEGSGMKVKTCQALMYGKNIVSTPEGFEGYELDPEKVGACCRDAAEFIRTLRELTAGPSANYNEYSRSLYLARYTPEAVRVKYEAVFRGIEHK